MFYTALAQFLCTSYEIMSNALSAPESMIRLKQEGSGGAHEIYSYYTMHPFLDVFMNLTFPLHLQLYPSQINHNSMADKQTISILPKYV